MSSKDSIICPNCEAQITADAGQLIVYCMYCGAKIQMRDIVEVRHVQVAESLEKMVTDGETYYKVENYYLAEKKYREVIKQYPEECAGYEGLLRTLTKNETVFPLSYETEIFRLLHDMEQLALKEKKERVCEQRKRMIEGYRAEHERVEMALRDREIDLDKQKMRDRVVYTVTIITVVAMIGLLFELLDFFPPIEFSLTVLCLAGGLISYIWRDYGNL